MLEYDQALKLVIETVRDGLDQSGEGFGVSSLTEIDESTRLFASEGILDSIGVVVLLTELEEALDAEHGIMVSLASESAMSKTRSPFRNVKSLAKYIVSVIGSEIE